MQPSKEDTQKAWALAKKYAPKYGISPEILFEFIQILKIYVDKVKPTNKI